MADVPGDEGKAVLNCCRGDRKIRAGMSVSVGEPPAAARDAQIDGEDAGRIVPQHAAEPVGEALGEGRVAPLLLGTPFLHLPDDSNIHPWVGRAAANGAGSGRAASCAAPRAPWCQADTSEFGVANLDFEPVKGFVVVRHRQKLVDEGRCLLELQRFEPCVLLGSKHHHGRRAASGHELRLTTSGRLHHGAEAILRILQGPGGFASSLSSSLSGWTDSRRPALLPTCDQEAPFSRAIWANTSRACLKAELAAGTPQ